MMKSRVQTSLAPHFYDHLEEALKAWCAVAPAASATVMACSGPERCPCGQRAYVSIGPCQACIAASPCRLKEEAEILVEVGAGIPGRAVACLRCSAPSGGFWALQGGLFSDQIELQPDLALKLSLAFPVLLWVKSLTEKAQAERELASEIHELMAAQEEEREWVALEVHDRVAQPLAAVFQQLQHVEGLASRQPELRLAVVRASLLCREAISQARNVMTDLQPPVLEELGLVPAMEEDIRRLAEEAPCRVKQALSLTGRPVRAVELALYRIFRESLVNIRRHARASVVEVTLRDHKGGIRLEVRDDGAGFNLSEAVEKKGVGGLLSMRRRAEMAGGALHIETQPGSGTTVSAWVPLSAPATRQ